ncbi:hypothetical protein B2K_04000 [Paenibacillus mucilaginosus K02]|uniref:Uncharacterized protein n=1 Tax=Paenibacillus mucilaginosus K02 TaxID=997761 RepID=I0BBZ7_9BACL|nr:hypothetical protein B2K_04000 [Paenibacillus mucilaginosus K02]
MRKPIERYHRCRYLPIKEAALGWEADRENLLLKSTR